MRIRKVLSDARRKGFDSQRRTLREVDEEKMSDEALKGFEGRLKEKSDEGLKVFLERLNEKVGEVIRRINETGEEVIRKILELGKGDQGKPKGLAEVAKEQGERELVGLDRKPLAEVAKEAPVGESGKPNPKLAEVVEGQVVPELRRPEPKPLIEVAEQPEVKFVAGVAQGRLQPYSPLAEFERVKPLVEAGEEQVQPGIEKAHRVEEAAEEKANPLMGLVNPQPQPKPLREVVQEPPAPELGRFQLTPVVEVSQQQPPPVFAKPQLMPLLEVVRQGAPPESAGPEPLAEIAQEQPPPELAKAEPRLLTEVVKQPLEAGLARPQRLTEIAEKQPEPEFDKLKAMRGLFEMKMPAIDESKIQAAAIAKGEEKDGKADYLEGEIARINAGLEGLRRELKEGNVKEKPERVEAMEKRPEKVMYKKESDEVDEIRKAVEDGYRDW